ncbi:MAG TPA: DUF177 domain-containing protein [Longimicrobiales bacterium]
MLKVDLGRLQRDRRVEIAEDLSPDDPMWDGTGLELRGPLAVRLDVQRVGEDVLVRGRLSGAFGLECRRCLVPVRVEIDEPVSLLFRPELDPAEAEAQEVYTFSWRERELDLTAAVREQTLLAVPKYAVCRSACRGLCPRCGVNLNEEQCRCEVEQADERWAALRKLKFD